MRIMVHRGIIILRATSLSAGLSFTQNAVSEVPCAKMWRGAESCCASIQRALYCAGSVMVYEVKTNTSATPSIKSYTDFIQIFKAETENLLDPALDSITRETCYAYWAYQMSWFLGYPKRIGQDCFRNAKEECKPFLFVFDYAMDAKARLVKTALRTVGLPLTMRMLSHFI